MELKRVIKLLGHAGSAPAKAIVADTDVCRVTDDAASIESGKSRGHSSHKVPHAPAAREKIGHWLTRVLDEMLDSFAQQP